MDCDLPGRVRIRIERAWLALRRADAVVAAAYFAVALVSSVLFALLTPPFQTPDEHQHFFHAYQIAAGARIEASGRAMGAVLPESLGALADDYLGSRKVYVAARGLPRAPVRRILSDLQRPLAESRKTFLDFTGAAPYPAYPYFPQICAIAVGRAIGAGPLVLLYAARLANALVAATVTAAAIFFFPYRRAMLAGFAALPMALALFGSLSPDAVLIAGALLLSSLTLRRAAGEGGSRRVYFGVAVLGAAVCAFKPVYAPLLLIGLPTTLRVRGPVRALLEHGGLVAVAIVAAVAWYGWLAPPIRVMVPWADQSRQLTLLLANPLAGLAVVANTLRTYGGLLMVQFAGVFGWLTLAMSPAAYGLVLVGIAANAAWLTSGQRAEPVDALWALVLFIGVFVLSAMILYLTWTPVGLDHADGLQGRYFLPAAGLLATALSSVRRPGPAASPAVTGAVAVVSLAPIILALTLITQAYGVFS